MTYNFKKSGEKDKGSYPATLISPTKSIAMYKCGLISDNTICEEDCMESDEYTSFEYYMSEDDFDDPMLRWINEETNYANSDRFDDDYDEDSAYYEGKNFW